jgi:hypothetical protein
MQSCSIVAVAHLESAVFLGEFWFAEEHQGLERPELGSVLCLRICTEEGFDRERERERERERSGQREKVWGWIR